MIVCLCKSMLARFGNNTVSVREVFDIQRETLGKRGITMGRLLFEEISVLLGGRKYGLDLLFGCAIGHWTMSMPM